MGVVVSLGAGTGRGVRVALSGSLGREIVEDGCEFVSPGDVWTVPGVDLDELGAEAADGLAAAPVGSEGPVLRRDDIGGRDVWSQGNRLRAEPLWGKEPQRRERPLQDRKVAVVEKEVRGEHGIGGRVFAQPLGVEHLGRRRRDFFQETPLSVRSEGGKPDLAAGVERPGGGWEEHTGTRVSNDDRCGELGGTLVLDRLDVVPGVMLLAADEVNGDAPMTLGGQGGGETVPAVWSLRRPMDQHEFSHDHLLAVVGPHLPDASRSPRRVEVSDDRVTGPSLLPILNFCMIPGERSGIPTICQVLVIGRGPTLTRSAGQLQDARLIRTQSSSDTIKKKKEGDLPCSLN